MLLVDIKKKKHERLPIYFGGCEYLNLLTLLLRRKSQFGLTIQIAFYGSFK